MRRVLAVLALVALFMAFGGTAFAGHGALTSPASQNASCMGQGLSAHASQGEPVSGLIDEDLGGAAGGNVGAFAKAFSKFHEAGHEECEHAVE